MFFIHSTTCHIFVVRIHESSVDPGAKIVRFYTREQGGICKVATLPFCDVSPGARIQFVGQTANEEDSEKAKQQHFSNVKWCGMMTTSKPMALFKAFALDLVKAPSPLILWTSSGNLVHMCYYTSTFSFILRSFYGLLSLGAILRAQMFFEMKLYRQNTNNKNNNNNNDVIVRTKV